MAELRCCFSGILGELSPIRLELNSDSCVILILAKSWHTQGCFKFCGVTDFGYYLIASVAGC